MTAREVRYRVDSVLGLVGLADRGLDVAGDVVSGAAQGLLHQAQALHEILPVHRAEHAQTANAVADGHLIGGLLLVLRLDQMGYGQARLGQALLDGDKRIIKLIIARTSGLVTTVARRR